MFYFLKQLLLLVLSWGFFSLAWSWYLVYFTWMDVLLHRPCYRFSLRNIWCAREFNFKKILFQKLGWSSSLAMSILSSGAPSPTRSSSCVHKHLSHVIPLALWGVENSTIWNWHTWRPGDAVSMPLPVSTPFREKCPHINGQVPSCDSWFALLWSFYVP